MNFYLPAFEHVYSNKFPHFITLTFRVLILLLRLTDIKTIKPCKKLADRPVNLPLNVAIILR